MSEYYDYIVENIDRLSDLYRTKTLYHANKQDINKGMKSLLYSLYIVIK